MFKDPLVDEVRKIRDEQAEKYNYDLDRILEQAIKRQKKSRHRTVSFVIRNKAHRVDLA